MTLLLIAFAAAAEPTEESEQGKEPVYSSKTEIDFEGLEIEGVLQRPTGTLVLDRKSVRFNPMIKLRTEWDDQVEESIGHIK